MLTEIAEIQKNARLICSEAEVNAAIRDMAKKINAHALAQQNPLILCVMNGGLVITGKLLTQLNFPLTTDTINVSRYGAQISGHEMVWKQKPSTLLAERVILVIDDILDEGLTLAAIQSYCMKQGAKYVFSAVLVDKQLDKVKPIQADFIGLSINNYYLYGSGMDYKGYLRNTPGLYAACIEGELEE